MATEEQLKNVSVLTLLPEIKPHNLADFFEKFEIYRNFAGWEKNQLCNIVRLKAGPEIKSVLQSSGEWKNIKDIDVLKTKLEQHFAPQKSGPDALQEFSVTKQLTGESIRDFAVRLETLASKNLHAKIEGTEVMSEAFRNQLIVNQFINGLNPNIKSILIIQNPTTLNDARQLAERIEKAQSGNVEHINVAQTQENSLSKLLLEQTAQYAKTVETLQKSLDEMKIELEKSKSEYRMQDNFRQRGRGHGWQVNRNRESDRRQSGQSNIVCFRCERRGHFARDCSWDFSRNTQGQRGRGLERGFRGRSNLN